MNEMMLIEFIIQLCITRSVKYWKIRFQRDKNWIYFKIFSGGGGTEL